MNPSLDEDPRFDDERDYDPDITDRIKPCMMGRSVILLRLAVLVPHLAVTLVLALTR